jgi:hypothetical protein
MAFDSRLSDSRLPMIYRGVVVEGNEELRI